MAVAMDGGVYQPLHQNYGILFAKAEISRENTIVEKGIWHPRIFDRGNGTWEIMAMRCGQNGSENPESNGKVCLWRTHDLQHFEELGLVDAPWEYKEAGTVKSDCSCMKYLPDGAICGNEIEISRELGIRLLHFWNPPTATGVRVPERVIVHDRTEAEDIRAEVSFSDGTAELQRVDWQLDGVDFSREGEQEICGCVRGMAYEFPILVGYADPVIAKWEGRYYFTATRDYAGQIGIPLRCADTPEGLFEKECREVLILDYDEEHQFVQTFWAPELHVIAGRLYVLFAVGASKWGPQCYLMRLREGGDPMRAEDWEEPVRVRKQDGMYLAVPERDAISLDMTCIETGEKVYLIWSYREHCMADGDTGSMLYIATADPQQPWILTSDPMLLSRPEYGWENNDGTINNEGPFPLIEGGKVHLTYSGGAAGGYTYVLGELEANLADDLLDLSSWTKHPSAVLYDCFEPGIYGPGHNSFFRDPDGQIWIAYHAQTGPEAPDRCTAIHRVHLAKDGRPVYDMGGSRGPKEADRMVRTILKLTART
jgi:GH43 family beta-xylosidase